MICSSVPSFINSCIAGEKEEFTELDFFNIEQETVRKRIEIYRRFFIYIVFVLLGLCPKVK
jgi:hypothetical protein